MYAKMIHRLEFNLSHKNALLLKFSKESKIDNDNILAAHYLG